MSGQIFLEAGELSVSETGGTILVAIVRSGDLSEAANVTFGVTPNDATEGDDYLDATGSIRFEPGQSRVLVPISILNDDIGEPTESFTLSLISTDSGSLLAPRTAKIDILDDEIPATDPPEPGLISSFDLQETTVVDDLNLPIAMQFSPTDSNIAFIAEKAGIIRRVDLSTGESSVFLDISEQVNNNSDRGLLNFVLHPDFESNGYFYLYYVVDPEDAPNKDVPPNRFAYVSRFEADPETNFISAMEDSEFVLVGGSATSIDDINGGGGLVRSDILANIDVPPSDYDPVTGEAVQDYIKVDSTSHAGGGLAFGPDGALYIATGDGIAFNFTDPRGVSVQDINTLTGKVLRIDPITGDGFSDNPFATADLGENASKVYQLGLRNPFRLAFDQNGQLLISETGWNAFEEINSGPAGANYGWPFYEGGDNGIVIETDGYKDLPSAAEFYQAVANGEIVISSAFRAFSHDSNAPGFQVQAITGSSTVYAGGQYDGVFDNHYFFADFSGNEIYAVNTNDRRDISYIGAVDGFRGPVDFVQDANGFLYYIDIVGGRIVRIDDIVETGGATIIATPAREVLEGSAGEDVFVFGPGTSTTTFLDTIVSWIPGDIIDLTALNLTIDDLDVRTISGGATLKIVSGFGPNDFQFKIDLNSFTQEQVLDALIFNESDLPDEDENTAPTANDDSVTALSGEEVVFNVLNNDTDNDGDTISLASFSQPSNGTLTELGGGAFSYVSFGAFSGIDAFTYTIEDGMGGQDSATASIDVTTANPGDPNLILATEGVAENLDGTPDQDTFVFGPRTSTTSRLDFVLDMQSDDIIDLSALGLQDSDVEYRLVGGGTILKIISGFGPDDFQLKVSLANISEAEVLAAIRFDEGDVELEPNNPPSANDDTATTSVDDSVSLNVLANDTDPENDPLTVDAFDQGSNGSVVDLGNGVLQYTPDTDFVGTDSFSYTISDEDGLSSTATVNVTIEAPVASNVIAASVGTETLTGTADADAFTFAPGTSVNGAIDIIDDWAPGDVIDLSALGLTADDIEVRSISGGATLKLIAGFGSDDFQVKIDLNGFSQEEVLNAVIYDSGSPPPPPPPPPPPTAPDAADDAVSTNLGTATTINVLANDSDVNGDPLNVSGFTDPANGTVIDLGGGNLEYTPAAGFIGTDTFTYTVSDGGLSSQATVNVTVVDPGAFNVVAASVGTETLNGTDGADAFTFAPGTSVNGSIDTVIDWAPGDVIDLTALGLSEADIEVRTISGGTILKLIEGFGAGEFHVKINLNGFSEEEVLNSVIYAESVETVVASAATETAAKASASQPSMPIKDLSAFDTTDTKDASSIIMEPVKDLSGETLDSIISDMFEPIPMQGGLTNARSFALIELATSSSHGALSLGLNAFEHDQDGILGQDMVVLHQDWDIG